MRAGRKLLEWNSTDDHTEDDWDFFIEEFNTLLNKKNLQGYWYVKVVDFGWRKLTGIIYTHAKDGRQLLQTILPDTDCSFRIHNYGKGLAIQNFHHDSPTGDEWYYLKVITKNTYERYKV